MITSFVQQTLKGNDDVAVCQVNADGSLSLKHYYNKGHSSNLLLSSNPTVGFSSIVTSYSNGNITCSFVRANSMSSVANYFDLNSQYFLLTASGPLSSSGNMYIQLWFVLWIYKKKCILLFILFFYFLVILTCYV